MRRKPTSNNYTLASRRIIVVVKYRKRKYLYIQVLHTYLYICLYFRYSCPNIQMGTLWHSQINKLLSSAHERHASWLHEAPKKNRVYRARGSNMFRANEAFINAGGKTETFMLCFLGFAFCVCQWLYVFKKWIGNIWFKIQYMSWEYLIKQYV